jgi:threonine synthase
MNYYSTNKSIPSVSLKEAVVKGLTADNGLFMPGQIKKFEPAFFEAIENLSMVKIG